MVTFCMRCGVSLPPFAITVIKEGKELPSKHFTCPSCGKSAGSKEDPNDENNDIGENGLIIKNGKSEKA